ncbi:hypothetical protein ACLI09_02540 [Flavobacterium sp. RHBU_24]|uniref:hypothetical protein n=1 Tax=Flavobacterium sp. RHBU_24 TaxID=3391185 RepID=UPI0039854BB0
MLKIKVKIQSYKDTGRTLPLKSGYRPLFNFDAQSKKSGLITFIGKESLDIGESGQAYVVFLDNNFLGNNLLLGKKITFDEGTQAIGDIVISEIYE